MDPEARMSENMKKKKKKKKMYWLLCGLIENKKHQYNTSISLCSESMSPLCSEENPIYSVLNDEKILLKVKTGTFLMFRKKDFILLVDAGKTKNSISFPRNFNHIPMIQ